MSAVFAIYTSDPNLIRCELHRLKGSVQLDSEQPANAVGGAYAQDDVLLRRYGAGVAPRFDSELWSGAESDAFLYHAQRLPVGLSLEENTQPFRFRRWLFAHAGALMDFPSMRTRVLASLPEFLQRQIRGDTGSEVAFALYLKLLRERGNDDQPIEAPLAAQLLGKTVRLLEQFSKDAGITSRSTLNLVATNGRLLVATRYGSEPLYYALLEGSDRCERCGLDSTTPNTQPLMLEHLRSRTVALTSRVTNPSGWIEIPEGTAIAVGKDLSVQKLPI
jgi:glutamine amidotransferase